MYKLIKKIMNVEDVDGCENERNVYLGFRPSNAHIMTLLKNNSKLESLQVAENFEKTFSKMSMDLCQMKGVKVLFENLPKNESYINAI